MTCSFVFFVHPTFYENKILVCFYCLYDKNNLDLVLTLRLNYVLEIEINMESDIKIVMS